MKRFAFSLAGGVLIPVSYLIFHWFLANAASLIFDLFGRQFWLHDWAESAGIVFILPLSWPSHLYYNFFPAAPETIFPGLEPGNLAALAVGNFVLYSVITYAILTIKSDRNWR